MQPSEHSGTLASSLPEGRWEAVHWAVLSIAGSDITFSVTRTDQRCAWRVNSGRRRPAESVLAAVEVLSPGEAENHDSVGVCGACVF